MPEQRATVTKRLLDVIQLARLGHRTGVLTVERGEGSAFEEGSITFVNGQITSAHTGQHINQDALNRLSAWGTCLFTFIQSSDAADTPHPAMPDLPPAGGAPSGPISRPHTPHRMRQVDEALSLMTFMGFSRAHRQLFLLIDGQRSVTELIRLTGYEPARLQELLEALAHAGLIQE